MPAKRQGLVSEKNLSLAKVYYHRAYEALEPLEPQAEHNEQTMNIMPKQDHNRNNTEYKKINPSNQMSKKQI